MCSLTLVHVCTRVPDLTDRIRVMTPSAYRNYEPYQQSTDRRNDPKAQDNFARVADSQRASGDAQR